MFSEVTILCPKLGQMAFNCIKSKERCVILSVTNKKITEIGKSVRNTHIT